MLMGCMLSSSSRSYVSLQAREACLAVTTISSIHRGLGVEQHPPSSDVQEKMQLLHAETRGVSDSVDKPWMCAPMKMTGSRHGHVAMLSKQRAYTALFTRASHTKSGGISLRWKDIAVTGGANGDHHDHAHRTSLHREQGQGKDKSANGVYRWRTEQDRFKKWDYQRNRVIRESQNTRRDGGYNDRHSQRHNNRSSWVENEAKHNGDLEVNRDLQRDSSKVSHSGKHLHNVDARRDVRHRPAFRTREDLLKSAQTVQEVNALISHGNMNAEETAQAYQTLKNIYKSRPSPQVKEQAEETVKVLSEDCVRNLEHFGPRHMCFVIGAHAHIKIPPCATLLHGLAEKLLLKLHLFQAQDISQIFWGLGALGLRPGDDLIAGLSERALEISTDFNPQNVSNTLWSFATLEVQPEDDLVAALSLQVRRTAKKFEALDVSNTLWACGTLGIKDSEDMVEALVHHTLLIHRDFTAQMVSNTMWAFAMLGVELRDDVIAAFSRQVLLVSKDFNAQGVANTIWAYPMLGVQPGDDVIRALSQQIVVISSEFSPQNVSNTIWAFAMLGVELRDDVASALSRQIVLQSKNFISPSIGNTMWALAVLGKHPGDEVLAAISQQAANIFKDCAPKHICSTLWSFAVLNVEPAHALLDAACTQLLVSRDASLCVGGEYLRQLHQTFLFYRVVLKADDSLLPASFLELEAAKGRMCQQVFGLSLLKQSNLQKDVEHVLGLLGYMHQAEFVDPVTKFSIDILITGDNGERIAVEVDGPKHYLRSGGTTRPNGQTLFKKRVLHSAGYRVATVPYWEWNVLSSVAAKKDCMKRLLALED